MLVLLANTGKKINNDVITIKLSPFQRNLPLTLEQKHEAGAFSLFYLIKALEQ